MKIRATTSNRPISRNARYAACLGIFGILSICPTGSVPSAQAQFKEGDLDATEKFINFVDKGYGVLSAALWLLKKPGPSEVEAAATKIVAELNKVEAKIMNHLQAQMFYTQQQGIISLRARTQTVLDRFEDMASMRTNDPDIQSMRLQTQLTSEEVLTTFAETVTAGLDAEVSYQLAPAFNALLVTHMGILKMRTEITPNSPMPLSFFQTQLRRGMDTNYRLIGTQKQACGGVTYPPTRDRGYFIGGSGQLQAPSNSEAYKTSQLFVKKLGNRWTSYLSWPSGAWMDCNLATRQCLAPDFVVGGGGGAQSCDNPRHSGLKPAFQACLGKAVGTTVRNAFNADPVVAGIRASMRGMMSLGLVTIGTPGGPFPGTDVARGAYFDPWVLEKTCGTNAQGKAAGRYYPVTP
jgi:hypothetical protein